VRAQHNGPQLAVARKTLKIVTVGIVQRVSKLSKQMPKKGRMCHNSNALLWSFVQPLDKFDRPVATMLIRLAFVSIKDVLVVH
jgi:hypothetical protein